MGLFSKIKEAAAKALKKAAELAKQAAARIKAAKEAERKRKAELERKRRATADKIKRAAIAAAKLAKEKLEAAARKAAAEMAKRAANAAKKIREAREKQRRREEELERKRKEAAKKITDAAKAALEHSKDLLTAKSNPDPKKRDEEVEESAKGTTYSLGLLKEGVDFLLYPVKFISAKILKGLFDPADVKRKRLDFVYELFTGRKPTQKDITKLQSKLDIALPIDAIYKIINKESIYEGEPGDLTTKDYTMLALAFVPLPAARLGKIGAGIGIKAAGEVAEAGYKVLPKTQAFRTLGKLVKGASDKEINAIIASMTKAAPKGAAAIEKAAGPAAAALVKTSKFGFTPLLTKFTKSPLFRIVTAGAILGILFFQFDIIAWGLGFSPEHRRRRMDVLKGEIRSNLIQIDNLVREKLFTEARDLYDKTGPLIDEFANLLDSLSVEFFESIGASFEDKKSIVDGLREAYTALGVLIPAVDPEGKPFKPLPPQFTGLVTSVSDGDTITVSDYGDVRLTGVDTRELDKGSEISKYAGRVARDFLKKLVLTKTVTVSVDPDKERDVYGRILGVVTLDDRSINYEMRQAVPGTLTIHSSPTYAEVLLTGSTDLSAESISSLPVGITGTSIKDIPPGRYNTVLRSFGNKDFKIPETIIINADAATRIPGKFELEETDVPPDLITPEKEMGLLSVSADPEENLFIFINGVYSGKKTPAALSLLPDSYEVSLIKKGFISEPFMVTLDEGASVPLIIPVSEIEEEEEEINTSQVSISSNPQGAYIFLNGVYTGKKTPTLFNLEFGDYELLLEKSGFISDRVMISIVNTFPTLVLRELAPVEVELLPVVLITSVPDKANIFIDSLPTGKRTDSYFEISPGTHIIRVEKEGFVPVEESITIES